VIGIFVPQFTLVDLLASCGIMRPKRDPGGCGSPRRVPSRQ
jgi:hypothetical protein